MRHALIDTDPGIDDALALLLAWGSPEWTVGTVTTVPGNVTSDAEFNAHCDPEALARVLEAGVRVDLVPLDATRQAILERNALSAAATAMPGPIAERVCRFTERAFRVDLAQGTRGMV